MKKILALFALLLFILISVPILQNYVQNKTFVLPFMKSATATIKGQKFTLLTAKSGDERVKGLSERESLDKNMGMIFVFDKPDYYFFGMKNMKFPVDIIYINNNKIVSLFRNVRPPATPEENPAVVKPEQPANKVLEINGGLSDTYNIQVGDEVKIEGI